MTETEVRRLVRRGIDSVRAQESGVLPPGPYVVIEILRRCKTLKPWEGLAASQPMGRALRVMVEEILGKRPLQPKEFIPEAPEEPVDLRTVLPLEAARQLGTKKHRHLKKAI